MEEPQIRDEEDPASSNSQIPLHNTTAGNPALLVSGLILLFLVVIYGMAPEMAGAFLRWVANWFSFALIVGSAGTLLWFVYRICFRRLWRVRRIANIRLKRMLEERER